jgi:hypothetical protein
MKLFRLITLVALAAPVLVHAAGVPEDVARIFDKRQRTMDAPPSALRADSGTLDSRYASGLSRVQRAVGSTATPAPAPVPVPEEEELTVSPVAPVGQAGAPATALPQSQLNPPNGRVVIVREPREERRSERVRDYAFNGRRIVGLGFVGAGTYGIFGAEADLNFGNGWSGGLGLGTGMAYSSWGFYGRYYFQEERLSPFFQFGYAQWFMSRNPVREDTVYPIYLGEQFLQQKDGSYKVGSRVNFIYPAIGVLYQAESGLAATVQLQYLIGAFNFRGALAGSFGIHFYF